jgi:hypothetical protein
MDELIESMNCLSGHCPYDEYENLVKYIQLCESATIYNAYAIAKEIYRPIRSYTENIDLNPENYRFSQTDYNYITEIRKNLQDYWNAVNNFPTDYILQIRYALAYFKSINNYISQLT